MAQVVVKEEIAVPSERLWKLVADFGNVPWIPGGETARTEGTGPGMVRILGAGGGPDVRERLERLDTAGRSIEYTIPEGIPLPIRDYRSTMRVADAGAGKSALEWSCTFAPDGVSEAEATALVEGLYRMMMGWIRTHLGV